MINITDFYNLRNHKDCKLLNINYITHINFILNKYNIVYENEKDKKKKLKILKNKNIKIKKNKISNKINLILNKLSEHNIDKIVIEFINNIELYNIDNFNEFLKTIYNKIIIEIIFIKTYLDFFKIITYIYIKKFNHTLEYFYNLLEDQFYFHYTNKENNENVRLNNLFLIKELIKLNFFNTSFVLYIDNYILHQKLYMTDIYFWFNNKCLTQEQLLTIKKIINNNNIQLRDRVLLETLLKNNTCNSFINKSLSYKDILTITGKNTNIIENINDDIIENIDHNIVNIDNNLENINIDNNLENTNIIENINDNNLENINDDNNLENINDDNLENINDNIVNIDNNLENINDNNLENINDDNNLENINDNNLENINDNNLENINNDTIELDNILDEYLYINNSESLEYYIELNSNNNTIINFILTYLINKYFLLPNNQYYKLINLLNKLITTNILFKNNIYNYIIKIGNKYNNPTRYNKIILLYSNIK